MKLATVRTSSGTRAARIEERGAVMLEATDVGALLRDPDWKAKANERGQLGSLNDLVYAPLIVNPSKIICSGLNYAAHIAESGLLAPTYPILFAKFATALIGAHDDIVLPPTSVSTSVDWEAELAVVVGYPVARNSSPEDAEAAIAGYTVFNDVSVRDWQDRSREWLQGKTFEGLTPIGPVLITSDEFEWSGHRITCAVDGEIVQDSNTAELVFTPPMLVAYISQITTLAPGDVIATGTPGGIGAAMSPQRFLQAGNTVTIEIDGLGKTVNVCRAAPDN
jgi:acylpyruvate hydrolase